MGKVNGMARSYEMDMSEGPLFGKLLRFSIPLMFSGILQLLFNAADIVVVGRFAGQQSLAAVGSTSSFINLTINLFVGISLGVNAVVARHYGNRDMNAVTDTVHTAMLLSFISGIFLALLGQVITRPLLELMQSPDDVISLSTLYLKIYFLGMPAFMAYNFASSVLRAMGDTKRPLYFLLVAGIMNVCLNLVFVIGFNLDVMGVALATIISQYISAILVLLTLMRLDGPCRFVFQKMRLHWVRVKEVLLIGLPSGVQGILFSISNVMIQSNINSFGSVVMAGNSASANIEGFVYTSMYAFSQTAVSFVGQNFGAGKRERIRRSIWMCVAMVTVVGLAMGIFLQFTSHFFLGIYTTEEDVIAIGMERLSVVCTTYFLCGIMDTLVGSLRGLGYAIVPMFISILGICGLRILWMATVCVWYPEPMTLYLSYPVTWIITLSVDVICLLYLYRKIFGKTKKEA